MTTLENGSGTEAARLGPGTTKPRRRSRHNREENRAGLLLISPTFIIILVAVVLPIIWAISLAFQNVRPVSYTHLTLPTNREV